MEQDQSSSLKIWIGMGILGTLLVVGLITFLQPSKQDKIIVGIAQWVSNPQYEKNIQGFKDGLAKEGYREGKNIEFNTKLSSADKEKQRQIVQSFVQAKVDLMYSLTTPGTLIAKKATNTIPIVFSIVTYPVEAKLIDSMKSSKNNLVGTRNYIPPSRQYYAFERIYSKTKTLGIVHRKGEPNSIIQFNAYKKILTPRGINVVDIAATDLDNLRQQLISTIDQVDSLFSACDTLIQSGGEAIVIEISKQYKKPTFTCNKDGVLQGALIGNIADFYEIGKISGEKAALILKGSKPEWLQTESPREDHILINQKTADELGITIPKDLLRSAKDIITQ